MGAAEEPELSSPLQELTKLSRRECFALQGFREVHFTFIPLSGFSAFPSLLPLLTAIVAITKEAEQRASSPAATCAWQQLPWAAETNSATPKTWMQTGCQQEALYGSCASPISTDEV